MGHAPESIVEGGIKYQRIFSLPTCIVDSKKPKTLGALADQNGRKMEKEGKLKGKKKDVPWWRSGNSPAKLAKLNKKQRQKYIQEGKI